MINYRVFDWDVPGLTRCREGQQHLEELCWEFQGDMIPRSQGETEKGR